MEFFAKHENEISQKFSEIYLVRNERELKIYDKKGQAFETDFLLFCKSLSGEELSYQVFIEPKGDGFMANDAWKEEFLEQIFSKKLLQSKQEHRYLITAVLNFTIKILKKNSA